MELSRKNVIVAIGPHLEKIHRGYILSFRTTAFEVVKCAELAELVEHARAGAALFVLSADTGIPGTSSDDIIEKLSELEQSSDVPILFLRDPKNPTVTAPSGKTSRFTILSRWTDAREELGIKQLTAATPAKKVKPPDESFREAEAQLNGADGSSNFNVVPSSSDRADARDKSTETKRFFGIKKETSTDGKVAKELVAEPREVEPPREPEPPATPEPPAAPEPEELGSVAAVVSEIMAQSSDALPVIPSSPTAESQSQQEAFPTKSPLSEPAYFKPETAKSDESQRARSIEPVHTDPSDTLWAEEVASERSSPISGLEEESVVLAPELRPLSVSTVPPPPKKRPERRLKSSPMVLVLAVLVIGIIVVGVAVVVIWMQRGGQGVIVSGPTLGTVELTDGRSDHVGETAKVSPSSAQIAASGADADARVDEAGMMSFTDGSPSSAVVEAGVEPGDDEEPESSDGETTEFILPFKYVRSQRSPYNINHREFRKIIKFITTHRALSFEVVGHGAPDENPSFVKRLGYQRAKEARDLICRRGPKRRRFKLRSAGASVPFEAAGLTGKELINAHRRVVVRVLSSE